MQTFINLFFMAKLFPSILIASCLFAFSLPRREKFALRFPPPSASLFRLCCGCSCAGRLPIFRSESLYMCS